MIAWQRRRRLSPRTRADLRDFAGAAALVAVALALLGLAAALIGA